MTKARFQVVRRLRLAIALLLTGGIAAHACAQAPSGSPESLFQPAADEYFDPAAPVDSGWSLDGSSASTADFETSPLFESLLDDVEPASHSSGYWSTSHGDALHVELRGRIEADAIFAGQSEKNKEIFGDFENVVGFRRARLGAQGTVGQNRWVAEFDFASGEVAFKDVWLAIEHLPIVRQVRVGNFREPFSLEGQDSSNYFPFVERSTFNTLDPARNWGVGVFSYTDDELVTVAVGAFRSGAGSDGNDMGDGNDMAYTARLTCLPWYDDSGDELYLIHLGGAFSQRYPKNDVVTFNQAPQNSLLETTDNPLTPFVQEISIAATQNQLYNVQWAAVLDSLSLQAEWSSTYIDQIGGGPVFLHGWYAFASLFLTGEHRAYAPQQGTFGQTKVHSPFFCRDTTDVRGTGAWELVARIDFLDFANSNIPPVNGLEVGDKITAGTFGVNWYMSDHSRIMFNYIHAVPVDPNFGSSSVNGYLIRSAVFW